MTQIDVALHAVAAFLVLSAATLLYFVWRRQWTVVGLFVGLASLLAAAAHVQILAQMTLLSDYAVAPVSLGSITWHSGVGWGLLLLAIALTLFAAMCAALQPVKRWAAPAICLASIYILVSTGASAVQGWIAAGTLPQISIGVQWPLWLGFPAYLILIQGPFLAAIPWSFMRQAQLVQGETRAVLLWQGLLLGTVVTLLVVVGAAFLIGVLQGTAGTDERSIRAALTLAGVVALTIAVVVLTMVASRRTFLIPAVTIIEGVEVNRPVGDAIRPGSIWEPVAQSIERSSAELRDARALLQSFVDNIPMALTISDLSGKNLLVNPVAASHHDSSIETMIGADPAENFADRPDELQRYLALGQLVAESGEAQVIEITTRSASTCKDTHSLVTFFPLFDSDQKVAQLGTIATNVTALREAEEDLRETQAVLQSFFDNLPGMAFMTTVDGRIVNANSYAANKFGIDTLRPENLIGQSDNVLGPPEFADSIEHNHLLIQQGREVIDTEHLIETPLGQVHAAVKRFPVRNAAGEVTHIGGMIFDKTFEKRAQAELNASRESLHQTEKLAALGQLLAGVSHELNNPLAAVIGQSALLAEDLEGTEHAERVGKIRRAADRCARIVQSFLAMARQKAPEYRKASLNDLVRQAAELTEYQMRAGNVLVELQLDETLPAIEADPDQLHQVIVNLLTNARQAMEDNDGERRLTISTTHKRGQVRLRVADNGKGIAPTARARIFDPFFSTKDSASGTGIGLSYSLGIVEAHGGTLVLEDTKSGTAFAITLPVAKGLALADANDQSDEAQAQGRVLVIDDETDIADTLSEMLVRLGLEVKVALGGKAGLEAMQGGAAFDLVLSDIRMPEVDGPAVHTWIAANRPELLDRIVFVTGDTMGEQAANFLAAVDCPVLEKPFSTAALRDLVERMLQS